MTKKIIVIALAVVLCLSVIGGCFALYVKNADELNISFGSENAVTLKLNPGSLTFGNVKLNPSEGHRSASQKITLDVSVADKTTLTGMSGKLTVVLEGALANSLDLSAVADTVNYTQAQLTSGVTLPLNALPKDFTLTLALEDTIDDAGFKEVSNTTATVTVKWEVVDWAPVDGAYYIIGSHSGWDVNEKAIKMNDPAEGTNNLAEWYGTLPVGTEFKCVKYSAGADLTWYDLKYTGGWGSPAEIDVYGDGEGGVTQVNGNMLAPTSGEEIFVCVNTDSADNTKHYSWAQTKASMETTPAA